MTDELGLQFEMFVLAHDVSDEVCCAAQIGALEMKLRAACRQIPQSFLAKVNGFFDLDMCSRDLDSNLS